MLSLVFRWLAIPWIQAEIDDWMIHRNRSKPRADKHKILPHGIPDIIRAKPEHFGSYDFKVNHFLSAFFSCSYLRWQVVVPTELFDEVEQEYAPPEHPVFELVPPTFDRRANILYSQIGQPVVQSDTFWEVYSQLLNQFQLEEESLVPVLTAYRETLHALDMEEIQLLPNLKELRNGAKIVGPPGSRYIGGMVHGPPVAGLRKGVALEEEASEDEDAIVGSKEGKFAEPEYADFTSSESDDGDNDEDDRIDEF